MAAFLDDPNWLTVKRYDDPESLSEPEEFGDIAVAYADVVAVDFENAVRRSVDFVRSLDGVVQVDHVDRELVRVWGSIEPAALRSHLERWWRDVVGGEQGR